MNRPTPVQRILVDCFSRVAEVVDDALHGLDQSHLVARVNTTSNSIAWLVWHLSRVQDHHIATLAGREQIWTSDRWDRHFGLVADPDDVGYGHSSEQVAAVQPTVAQLLGYFHRVDETTRAYVASIRDEALEQVVDPSYDPPVTLEVRLVSVVSDCLQHAGQAAFARGALDAGWDNADG